MMNTIRNNERKFAGKHRRQRAYRRKKILVFIVAIAVILGCFSLPMVVSANEKKEQTYRYYTSVQINSGDTLWSIANTYSKQADMSVSDYIDLIKKINCLTSDNITSGQYITIMYYSSEYK